MKTLKSKITKQNRRRMRRRIISILTAVVVFLTTYALVLPAITMDTETAAQEPGLVVDQTVQEAVVSEPVQPEPIAAVPVAADPAAQTVDPAVQTVDTAAQTVDAAVQTADTGAADAAGADNAAYTAESSPAVTEIADAAAPLASPDAAAEDSQTEAEGEKTAEEQNQLATSPFVYDTPEYTVTVSFGETAQIPYGATISWREFAAGTTEYGASRMVLNEKLTADGMTAEELETAVTGARFFELLFYDKNGVQFLPADAVDVLVEYKDASNANINNQVSDESLYAVTFRTEDGQPTQATLITTNAKDGSAGVEAADGFVRRLRVQNFPVNDYHTNPVIGQVGVKNTNADTYDDNREEPEIVTTPDSEEEEEILTTQYLTADGEAYNITLTYGPEAGIPDDASLEVSEIMQASETYEEYVSKTENALDPAEKVVFARFFDIKIMKDGAEIQPNGVVNVKIELAETLTEEVKVVHFEHNDAQAAAETIDTPVVLDSARVEAEALENAVGFETESFSVFGVVETETITVPFTASDGSTYEISVEIPENANIPEDAKLSVTELFEGTQGYEEYLKKTADTLRAEQNNFGYVKFFDISIVKDGVEVQPAVPVTVSIHLLDKADTSNTQVIHFAENPVVMDVNASGSTVAFETPGFSVYAVVDDPIIVDESRMTLNFYSGETKIATVYVKNDDDTDEVLEQIIYDPGIGEVTANTLFKGWSLDKADYSDEDAQNAMDIVEIREWAKTKANADTITEGETHNFYAMIYQTYSVVFKDEDGATIHGEALIFKPGEVVTYVVNTPYTPRDQNSQFQGWYATTVNNAAVKKEDGTEIGSETTGPIPNSTTVIIPSSTTFTPRSPKGYWLVFNSNTESGTSRATYTPPEFVMEGNITEEPEEPTRVGYTFDGWYTDAACTEGNKFVFRATLSERTELFAKWTPVSSANYTVIIWQRNVDNTGDDFVESITLSGPTNTVINTVTQQGTGTNAYARVNGVNKTYEGFHLKEFDQNVTISPEGNSVLNVYYDRTEYTLRFFYARSYDVTTGGRTETYREYIGDASNGTISGVTGSQNNTYYTSQNGTTRVYWRGNSFQQQNWWQWNNYSGPVWEEKERQIGGTTRTYVQVNVNNEGFLQGRANNRNLEQSLTYRGSNDYQLLGGSNTWKDVNNSNINGNPLNLVSSDYLNKDEVTAGSIKINNVTTDVVTGSNSSSVQNVNTTYYYLDVKVRYGQSLENLWPVPNSTFNEQTMTSYNRGNSNYSTVAPLLEGSWAKRNNIGGLYGQMTTDLFVGNDTTAYFITYWRYENHYNYQYNVYFSTLEGETPTTTHNGVGYVLQNDKSYTVANGQGWGNTSLTESGQGYWDVGNVTFDGTNLVSRVDVQSNGSINVYYQRKIHNIIYHDGIYVNGDNGTIQNRKDEAPLRETAVLYGQDISIYAEGQDRYYEPEAPEGYVFEGWYMDSEGQHPYVFSGTMPDKDIEVYAKWRQIQYRVMLHPQVPADATNLDWGGQEMSFRVNEGEKIAGGNKIIGTADGYEFIGWYTDPACTNSFEMSAVTLNNETVTTQYDTTDDGVYNPTDPTELDDRGNPTSSENKDATQGRYWITRKLDLYGKWRATIEGAKGISVVYLANSLGDESTTDDDIYGHFGNGEATSTDPMMYYLDRAEANAAGASIPNETDKYQFMHWVIQRWDTEQNKYVDTDQIVYPGDTFEVLKAYAKVEDIPGATDPENNKKYIVQLRAEYGDKGAPTPTHIDWYPNYVEGENPHYPIRRETELQINEAVPICEAPSRAGYKFLGWARIPVTKSHSTNTNPPTADILALTASDLFLTYHEENGGYYTAIINNEPRTVTKVAADEVTPYHDMYAVWEKRPSILVQKTSENETEYIDEAHFILVLGSAGIDPVEGGSKNADNSWTMTNGEIGLYYTDLDDGTYTLTETAAPAGYIVTDANTMVYISNGDVYSDAELTTKFETNSNGDYIIKVKNQTGKELPMTGGSGTLPYTLGGIALVGAAALMYGFRMRRRERRSR